ncbi:MAG: diaminohydroxyphosphoribosylaminopyrimidine deaminase [Cellvibrionaceae bacterium]|jgi:diaminohydroxyphosphoribosylaminopyrimidine deaminase/5-amino-6-(5-phosphoribosylamino)uracil reductase
MTTTDADHQWMSRALQLAQRGRYTARPNPCVGCVIVKNQLLLAEGWHYRAGEPHAEIHALAVAGARARGATAYVSLEPCSHWAKTGPCSRALIEAGVARVVYAMEDPNPQVAGSGIHQLRNNGIEVDGPILETAAQALNPGFISRMTRRRPWVRCKLASSLDGRTAVASGESQWITSAAARSDVQRWRARSSAIISGIGSILQDNSQLTLRAESLPLPNIADVLALPPLRVVLDTHLRISLDATVLKPPAPTLLVVGENATANQKSKFLKLRSIENVRLLALPLSSNGRLPLVQLLKILAQDYQCNEVLLEAGAILSGAFLQLSLIDEIIIYQAPILLGSRARPLFDLEIEQMDDKKILEIADIRQIGPDQRIIAKLKKTVT